MKNYLIALIIVNSITFVSAQEKSFAVKPEQSGTLESISINISQYKDKDQLLKLRLRNIDYVFEKITFYDEENIDIIFDITGYEKKPILL